jgi:glycosyltransferase involved in cell wall biosynthesis
MMPFRTVYVTSHVGPHPMHRALVKGAEADVGRVDYWLRSIDRPRPKWQQYLSWLMNAWASPYRRDYQLFVLEGFQIPPMLMKWMRRIDRRRQKVVCHHTAEQLYFLQTGFYSKKTDWLMRRVIKDYDAHIVVGKEQTRLLHEVLDGRKANIYTVYCTHVGADKYRRFLEVAPALDEKRILFVGNIYGDWRVHYKGLDLLLDGFQLALASDPALSLTVIGTTADDFQRLVARLRPETRARVQLEPYAEDLSPHFSRHALLALTARGDAFPTVVLEGLAAGVPALLSEFTGNKEVAQAVAPELVAPLDAAEIARRILWYFGLEAPRRRALSAKCRTVAADFTEEKGVQRFREALLQIHRDLLAGGAAPGARDSAQG